VIPAGLLLVDTSAIARAAAPAIAAELSRLGRDGLLATTVTIDLQVLYSARNASEYRAIAARRRLGFVDLPLHPAIATRVRDVQAGLAARGQLRAVGAFDLLTAAIAEHHAATVLHYDSDFDHIAAVTGQPMRWVVARGSVD